MRRLGDAQLIKRIKRERRSTMLIVKSASLALAAALALAAPVWAGETSQGRVGELATAKQNLARATNRTTAAYRQELVLEKLKVQSLIDDLQAGKRVDPAEIDRALEQAEQDTR
jgi:hypothetical protein